MIKYSVINLKTDPLLKEQAAKTADQLGISISAVLNNELRRFVAEQSVAFEVPEVPNPATAKLLAAARDEIATGDYRKFGNNKEALGFLADQLK